MKKLSVDLIQELSTELGIAPAFIEKDYYVVELLKILNEFQTDKFNVFLPRKRSKYNTTFKIPPNDLKYYQSREFENFGQFGG